MAVETAARGRDEARRTGAALDALAAAARAIADAPGLSAALAAIVRAGAAATAADVAVARVAEAGTGDLVARAVHATSSAFAAEVTGSRVALDHVSGEVVDDVAALPPAVRRAAARASADAVLQVPVRAAGETVASVELLRAGRPFDAHERALAGVVADHVAAALRAFEGEARNRARSFDADEILELAGEALAAGADDAPTAHQVARLAAEATGAVGCLLWRGGDGGVSLLASAGTDGTPAAITAVAEDAARRVFEGSRPVTTDELPAAVGSARFVTTLQLGQPPVRALQLLFARDEPPSDEELARLATFGVRAAHALRATERSRTLAQELERTRSLLSVVAQANEQLSLSHALQTALERVAELLDVDRVVVYLREDGGLVPAAGRGVTGFDADLADRLLELALGPFRGRAMLAIEDAAADPRLRGYEHVVAEAGVEAAVAIALLVQDEAIGLLALYPPRGRKLTPHETELISALAAQLAVAVQNARLHERATKLGTELEDVLTLERQAARQLRALYEISRAFAQSLSLETTLEAVARTVVELLDVDAAVIRMPDARGETLVPRALHVSDPRVAAAVRTILARPQPFATVTAKRLYRTAEPVVLTPETARALGPPHELLIPFLEKGSTAVIVPIATPTEVLGTLKLLSLDPERPVTAETIEIALSVAAQAALAIDNARLYQQQKEFSDTMQRSLLPRTQPRIPGLELGEVYESSARVDVGGDLYDFMTLDDGRLAVVLGDVTGHGIDAAADMAMAKFVFRSLAREHPEPGEFLAHANEVVVGEIGTGKFITMLYLVVDPATGTLAVASAGHPGPRVVLADGTVAEIEVRGLALGIDAAQEYEEVRQPLPRGAAVVVYTDGLIEARQTGELYGHERLDRVLAARRALPARELARAVVADCRAFAGEDLADDCAIVVIKRV